MILQNAVYTFLKIIFQWLNHMIVVLKCLHSKSLIDFVFDRKISFFYSEKIGEELPISLNLFQNTLWFLKYTSFVDYGKVTFYRWKNSEMP